MSHSSASNESFIGYCEIHSKTERALFHVDDVRRLLDLAGRSNALLPGTPSNEWFAMRHETVAPLVRLARERVRRAGTAARDELLAAGFVEGVLEA